MTKLLYLFTTLILLTTPAFALNSEIQALNNDYGHSQEYPILILDKEDVKLYLKSQNLNSAFSERDLVAALMVYFKNRFNYLVSPSDAFELLPYINGANSGASAMPFFVDKIHYKMKYCVVLPSEPELNHQAEVKRILGADEQEGLFKGLDLEKIYSLMSSEEIQLFSLYHEMSHCLDHKFLPQIYESETDAHKVHLAESFAEINALVMLSQRKGLHHLGYPRSLIRTAYSKYYGPFLAQSSPAVFSNLAINSGGSTYFLAPPLMRAQEFISANPQRINSMSLAETLDFSQKIVEKFALSKFGFEALRMSFMNGRENTLAHYQKLSSKAPHIFAAPHKELMEALFLMDSVEENISKYPSP